MRKTIATLGVVGLGLMSAAVTANAAPADEKKITICHATSAEGNAFVAETINLSALVAHADDTLDIVPANDGDIYPDGQNLDAANIALLANNCVAVVVPPADPDPEVETPDPEVETPDPEVETPDPEAEAPGADTTPASANTPAPAVLAPKAAVPAAKPAAAATKTNAGYNVQTAAGRTSDTGIPVWLMALTGVFTAGAATVVWQGGRRARSTEN
ncbi:hypothetical protein J2W14_002251 [Pseudarthrobacter oxydans]|uniref:hypothetical protein n=1 Tax=Pseudarthrobacter oxydans TaxID=1671 RepID=UPI00277FCD4C|nr:hypothetical protein [Pseudarthrobacter oxydans]MDP9982849.1 hypothetical protein [Pseudarthrobacter oxydans]